MAWTAPRTWVTNEVVTSTIMNTHVRDNLLGILHPVHVENTDIAVTNSTTETSQFSTPPTISADTMGVNGWFRAHIWCSYINNTATRTMTLRVKFGGTTHITAVIGAPSSGSTTVHSVKLEVDVINQASASAQLVTAHATGARANNTANGSFDGAVMLLGEQATATIATTSNQTFDVSVQWSAVDTNVTWTKLCSRVMLMQA